MVRSLFFPLAAAGLTAAHFTLNWPPTAGFDDDEEPTAPCGGATVVVNDTSPQIQVDRFAVQIFSSHPAGTWTFLATTNTEAPYDFQEIVPEITTTGPGDFCLTELRVPSDFAGKQGVLQVIDNSVDGTLYQCAPVNFVTGSNSTLGSACANNTGFTAQWTTTSTSNTTSDAPTSTSTGAASVATGLGSMLGLGLLAAGLAL